MDYIPIMLFSDDGHSHLLSGISTHICVVIGTLTILILLLRSLPINFDLLRVAPIWDAGIIIGPFLSYGNVDYGNDLI